MARELWVTGSASIPLPDDETETDESELVGKYWDQFEWDADYFGIEEY